MEYETIAFDISDDLNKESLKKIFNITLKFSNKITKLVNTFIIYLFYNVEVLQIFVYIMPVETTNSFSTVCKIQKVFFV